MVQSARTQWLVAVLLSMLFVSGCAGGNSDGQGEDARDSAETAQLAFAKCMRSHGVNVPDPEPGEGGMIKIEPGNESGSGPDRATLDKAHKACAKHMKGMDGPADGEMSEADKTRMLKFAACMREHGVDMADPDFSEGGGVTMEIPDGGGSQDSAQGPGNPEFEDAQKACRQYFGPAS